MKKPVVFILLISTFCAALSSCKKSSDDTTSSSLSSNEEMAQQVGDTTASIDESGGSTGAYAVLDFKGESRMFSRLAHDEVRDLRWSSSIVEGALRWLSPSIADAALCRISAAFSACTVGGIGSARTRTYDSCTVLLAVFSGSVSLAWSRTDCSMQASGEYVTRSPSFTVTGRRGATLTVSKTGTFGQKITRGATAGVFTFTNDGIRRKFTDSSGNALLDFTTTVTGGLTISGALRAGRVLSGGTLTIANNLTGVTCSLTPSSVTWAATCNCPTSGSWSGSCSDGSAVSKTITGCGTAQYTIGSETGTLTYDRCYEI